MIGQSLSDRYSIIEELGRGGMGVVYRAYDPLLNREVAIKLIPPTLLSPETDQRFQREAQLVAQMDHPAIVPIFDFGKHDGSLFFVMPVVQGTNLRWFEREAALTLGDVIDIGIQVAEALDYSHSRSVIHRDIKPENIMVTKEDGGRVRVRIMDFGLARGATESRITKTGTIAGTLAYMSPEQVSASGVDARSDIYSLGTVLYECLTGEPPFSGELQSILYRIVHEIPQPPRTLGADINEDLEAAILACIAKEPGKRPQRANEVAESLRRCQTRLHQSDLSKSVVMTKTLILPRVALSPFIGREKELAEFQKRLNAAINGECQFVVVSGEPGVGKTRLLDEIENLAKARKLMVLHGRSIEQDGAFPYQGFCEAIQEYFRLKDTGILSGGSIDLSDIAPDLVSLFPMLTEISEIRSAATGDSKLAQIAGSQSGPENRTQIFELLARTLTRVAGGRPLILFLEDLHAAEISIEALQYIVRRLGPTPTLIAGTYRSTDVGHRHPLSRMLESFRGDRRFSSIDLGPFSPSEHRLFLETLIGGPKLADSLVEKLFEGTEGNPFFTKELVRSLLDSGSISKDQTGAWSLGASTDLSPEELPATIQQAVEKRIERLPQDLREILSVASVIGKAFDFRDLGMLAEGKDLEDAIDRLVEDGLIEEERESRGDRLAFSSGVVRDVLYRAISRRKRRSLHRKYAEQIEKRHSGRLDRIYPQLVHHFSQGDVPDKTVEYGLRLAKATLDAFSAEEAARAAKTVLDFLDDEWEGDRSLEGDARVLLAQAHRMAGDVDAALKEAETAGTILERENQKSGAVAAWLLAAEIAWQARKVEETTRLVQQVMAAARAAGDSESLRHVLSLAATVANLRGEYEKANEYLEEAGRLAGGAKEAEAQEEIPKGGRLVVALATPVGVIEPVNMELVEEQEILANVFETLLATDLEGNLVPALCEKWEVTKDGTSFLFTLRDNVRFQDGHPLMAEDVKRSFERSVRLARELPPALAVIRGVAEFVTRKSSDLAGIIVHSDHKLEIQLLEPLSIYPALLTDYKTGITRTTAETADTVSAPIGSGPFRLASYGDDRIVLKGNPEYWKGSSAALDEVEFRAGLSAAEIATGLRSGGIDLARDLSPQDLEEFLRDPRFRSGLAEAPRKNIYFVLFNSATSSLVQKTAVRQALSGIVRTHDLVWQTLGRFAQPAVCLIPPGLLGHDPGRRRHTLTRDEALAMLRSAGPGDAICLRASVHPLFQDRYKSLLTTLFSIWSELGVEVEIATPTMASYLETFQNSAGLDLFIGRWNADYDDADDFTYGLFHSRVGVYRNYISSAEGDSILEEARTENRPGVRASLYRKYESFLLESGMLLPLFHDVDYRLANSKVRGLKLRGSAPYVNYAEIGKLKSPGTVAETMRASGGVIQVPITGTFHRLDPSLATTVEDGEVLPSIFETLTHNVGGTRIVPWLAEEFAVEDGGKRYRFHLRGDIRFHDGRKLTARDVRYSFERLLQNSDSPGRFFYAPIRGAKALLNGEASTLAGFRIHSGDEFTIELDEPISFFPALIAYHVAAIVPEGTNKFVGSWQEGCVGTGPFRIVKFEPGFRLELERNKTYWRKGYPKCEEIVFSFGVTPADILSEFRAGRFSLASDLLPADAEALRREPNFASSYRETPRLITYYVVFNTKRGPLSDKGLRRRLAQTLDVAGVVRQTLGRLAVPAHGLIPPGLLGHDSSYVPRVSVALSPASEQPSTEIEVTAVLNPVFFGEYSALYREISSAFREHGVKIRPVNKTMDEWLEAVALGSVDLVVGRWAADYPDADTFANILDTKAGQFGKLCGSPEVDRLIEWGRLETSPAARHAVYRQIEEIIARDTLLLPLFHEQTYRFARPEVEGLALSYGVTAVDYASLCIQG